MSKLFRGFAGLLAIVFLFSSCASAPTPRTGFLSQYDDLIEDPIGLTAKVEPGVQFQDYQNVLIAPVDFSWVTGHFKEEDKTAVAEWYGKNMREEMLSLYPHVAEDKSELPQSGKTLRINITVTQIDWRKGPAFEGKISDEQTGEVLARFMHKEKTIRIAGDIKDIQTAMPMKLFMKTNSICYAAAGAWARRIAALIQQHSGNGEQESDAYVAAYFALDDQIKKMPDQLPPLSEWRAKAHLYKENGKLETLDVAFPEGYCLWKLKPGRYKELKLYLLVFPESDFSFTKPNPPLWATLQVGILKQTLNVKSGNVLYLGRIQCSLGPPPKATNAILGAISGFAEKMGGISDRVSVSVSVENRREEMAEYLKEKLPGQKFRLVEQIAEAEPNLV